MPKIQTYNNMTIETLRSTEEPQKLTKRACSMTMQAIPETNSVPSNGLLSFLIDAEHTSVLEHCSITFGVSGVSRSLLAQLSRHRLASITSQSQHYQDYRDVPLVFSHQVASDTSLLDFILGAVDHSLEAYVFQREQGVAKEEARQVLMNAAAVNILWTINARSLINFFRQRLCARNVAEMKMFAERIYTEVMTWWPELFQFVGPPCFMDKKCNQGSMRPKSCGAVNDTN